MDQNSIVDGGTECEAPPARTWLMRHATQAALTDPVSLLAPGLDAMFEVARGLFEPLRVDTDIVWLNTKTRTTSGNAPHMEWRLTQRGMDSRWWPVADTLMKAESIDRRGVEWFLRQACAQTGTPGTIACPVSVDMTGSRVRFVEPISGASWLHVERYRSGPAVVPFEHSDGYAYVSGPQDGLITAPIALHCRFDAYELTLRVSAHWSPWADADRPGTRAIEERITRLVANGWELAEQSLP